MTVPDDLLALEGLHSVEEVTVMKDSYADFVAILCEANTTEVRVEWLKNLRYDWQWKGDSTSEEYDNGYVQFERKE